MSNTPNLKYARKRLIAISSLRNRGRSGGLNECNTPARGASKADLVEFHQEALRNRRHRQLAHVANCRQPGSASIATGNRHGGAHLNAREIARRIARKDRA